MTVTGLLFIPLIFGLVGAITPCALGINAVFLGYVAGKPRPRRLWEWLLFALARATLLTALGLAFALLWGGWSFARGRLRLQSFRSDQGKARPRA